MPASNEIKQAFQEITALSYSFKSPSARLFKTLKEEILKYVTAIAKEEKLVTDPIKIKTKNIIGATVFPTLPKPAQDIIQSFATNIVPQLKNGIEFDSETDETVDSFLQDLHQIDSNMQQIAISKSFTVNQNILNEAFIKAEKKYKDGKLLEAKNAFKKLLTIDKKNQNNLFTYLAIIDRDLGDQETEANKKIELYSEGVNFLNTMQPFTKESLLILNNRLTHSITDAYFDLENYEKAISNAHDALQRIIKNKNATENETFISIMIAEQHTIFDVLEHAAEHFYSEKNPAKMLEILEDTFLKFIANEKYFGDQMAYFNDRFHELFSDAYMNYAVLLNRKKNYRQAIRFGKESISELEKISLNTRESNYQDLLASRKMSLISVKINEALHLAQNKKEQDATAILLNILAVELDSILPIETFPNENKEAEDLVYNELSKILNFRASQHLSDNPFDAFQLYQGGLFYALKLNVQTDKTEKNIFETIAHIKISLRGLDIDPADTKDEINRAKELINFINSLLHVSQPQYDYFNLSILVDKAYSSVDVILKSLINMGDTHYFEKNLYNSLMSLNILQNNDKDLLSQTVYQEHLASLEICLAYFLVLKGFELFNKGFVPEASILLNQAINENEINVLSKPLTNEDKKFFISAQKSYLEIAKEFFSAEILSKAETNLINNFPSVQYLLKPNVKNENAARSRPASPLQTHSLLSNTEEPEDAKEIKHTNTNQNKPS